MLADSSRRIGENIEVTISFDPIARRVIPPQKLLKVLENRRDAAMVFNRG
jgi:hypothetical protein